MEKIIDKPEAKPEQQTSPSAGPEYKNEEARRQVSDVFRAAEEQGKASDQVLDNRTGFTQPEGYGELDVVQYASAPGVRSSETADSGQYGEGGRYSADKEEASRHNNPSAGKTDDASGGDKR